MINKFKTHNGQEYALNKVITITWYDMKEKDKEYLEKAQKMANEQNCNVFYSLKPFGNDYFDNCQYFLIPVDAYDTEVISYMFDDYLVGIAYGPQQQYLSFSEQNEIRANFAGISGLQYEELCAKELTSRGFYDVQVTKASGDQGIDVIAWKDGIKCGIQCKYYKGSVSNKAVQEAFSGAKYYDCDVAAVMTNSDFTKSAIELADKLKVELINFEGTES